MTQRRLLTAVLPLLALLSLAAPARAQFVSVTAQVKDANGTLYSNCQASIAFVPSPSATLTPTISGSTFQLVYPVVACDSSGNFTATLVDNNQVVDGHSVPPSSEWNFSICSAKNAYPIQYCFQSALVITGSSQNITAALTAAAPLLPTSGGGGGSPCGQLWSATATYPAGCTATFNDILYISRITNMNDRPDISPTQWQASGGGGGGICGGLWSSTTPYTLGCAVSLNGSIFVSLDSNLDSVPAVGNTDWLLRGTSALVDPTFYGARATDIFNSFNLTANCSTSTPTTITALSATGDFQGPGDGIALFGCGAATALSTPAAPTVAVVEPKDLVGTGYTVAASGLGSTTYTVKIAAYDAMNGGTAASPATTITNGPATLGSQTTVLTSCARSGFVVTCVASAPENIKTGSLVNLENTVSNTSTGDFDGWWIVGSAPDSTHFTYTGGLTTAATTNGTATATSATGGKVTLKAALNITWPHDANAMKHCAWLTAPIAAYIGCSRPNSTVDPEDFLEYYGATESGNLVRPLWVPATPPATPTSQVLATTLTSAITGGSFTIADSVQTTLSGATVSYDNSKAFTAACTAAFNSDAILYIPPGQTSSYNFTIAAPTSCFGAVTVQQDGGLDLEDTLTLTNRVNWHASAPGGQQFALANGCGTPVFVGAAYPGIKFGTTGGNSYFNNLCMWNIGNFENPTQTGDNNGSLLMMGDESADSTWQNVSFITGSANANDYTGIGFLMRCQIFGCNDNTFNTISLLGGPSQTEDTTWTPELMGLYGAGNVKISIVNATVRGMFWQNAGLNPDIDVSFYHCQACEMPMFTFSDPSGNISGDMNFSYFANDTGLQPDVSVFAHFFYPTNLLNMDAPGQTSPGIVPGALSGIFDIVIARGGTRFTPLGQNTNVTLDGGGTTATQLFNQLYSAIGTCNTGNMNKEVAISDSPSNIWGTTVSTGGGSFNAKLYCNGSVWTVEGASGGTGGGSFNQVNFPNQGSTPPGISATTTVGANADWLYFNPSSAGPFAFCGSTGSFTSGHVVAANASGTKCELVDGGGGTGSGTVTNFSANAITTGTQNFATAAVTSPGVTPALTFTLANSPAHKVFANCSSGSAAPDYTTLTEACLPATTVFTDIANTFGAHLNDFSAATIKAPAASGATASSSSSIIIDTATGFLHGFQNGNDRLFVFSTNAGTSGQVCTSNANGTCTYSASGGITLQTNGSNNTSQTALNFVNTTGPTGITATNPSTSTESFNVANATGGGNALLECTVTGATAGQYFGFDTTPKCVNQTPGISPNVQSGTSYSIVQGDLGRPVFLTNASVIAVALAAPGAYTANFYFCAKASGVGTVTITPASGTIDGSSTKALTTGTSACVYTDGTNYYTLQ